MSSAHKYRKMLECLLLFHLVFLVNIKYSRTQESTDNNTRTISSTTGTTGGENDMYDTFATHPCRRECRQGDTMTCYYKLYIHNYQMMGPECQKCLTNPELCDQEHCIYGDGVAMPLILVNYQFPGPPLELCQYDKVIVDIYNNVTQDVTIHWHGMRMAKTPESDGAPMVTQYPIQPGHIQRICYQAEESGTMWYHSHVDAQRGEGVYGILIIRRPPLSDPHFSLYDFDHVNHSLILHDIGTLHNPRNILINGHGRQQNTEVPDEDSSHRYYRLFVTDHMRHRIRIAYNGITDCPVEVSFQNHSMQVIASDGNDVEPVTGDKIHLTSGERFDVVISARNTPGVYWIKVRGMHECDNIIQYALLHYMVVPINQMPLKIVGASLLRQASMTINNIDSYLKPLAIVSKALGGPTPQPMPENRSIAILNLRSLTPVTCQADQVYTKIYLTIGFVDIGPVTYLHTNNITYTSPTISMLQGRHLYNEDAMYCNSSSLKAAGTDCGTTHCKCPHVVRVPAFKCIELIVSNNMDTTHPYHIHGYTFRLVGQNSLGSVEAVNNIEELDRMGQLQRLSPDERAVEKDTVQIPATGYVIIRFKTDNPGFWLMHCHIERHSLEGMVAVLKVGENDQIKELKSINKCL